MPAQGRYYWVYQGNDSWNTIKLGLIALAVVACCCYQVKTRCCCPCAAAPKRQPSDGAALSHSE